SAEFAPEVEKKEEYRGWGIYWGTTAARVKAEGCKVQYVVPLETFSSSNIKLDPDKRIMTVILPRPKVDDSIVEIPLDRVYVESSSAWARFNKGEMAKEAQNMLRAAALAQISQQPGLQELAEKNVKEAMQKLIESFDKLQPGVRVDVEFEQ
ncbi:MAG: DUF4230 domain-containing protein, partial [Phycisphaerales bacterium]|nr:DUF4230 domain-containing protein [Phycisphaerales bacterium]